MGSGRQRRRRFHPSMVWQRQHQEIHFLRRRRDPLRLKRIDTRQPVCKHWDRVVDARLSVDARVVGDAVFDIAAYGHDIATAIQQLRRLFALRLQSQTQDACERCRRCDD